MIDVCSVCHNPAVGGVNVNLSAASSVPSRFERRCAEHGGKMPGTMTMTDQPAAAGAAAPGLSEEWVGEHPMMPGDTPDYSAWVERLEPIAAQRVGWMNDRITELTDRLRAADADLARTRAEAEALRPSGEQDECPLPERLDPELGKIVRDRVACGQFLDPERAGSLLDAAVKTRRDLSDTWTRLCHVAQDRASMLATERNLRRALVEARADLTRTRAEAAALKTRNARLEPIYAALAAIYFERGDAKEAQDRLADLFLATCPQTLTWYSPDGPVIADLSAVPQSEPRPAAPVAPSAEASDGTR
jgi:hypothetical protein